MTASVAAEIALGILVAASLLAFATRRQWSPSFARQVERAAWLLSPMSAASRRLALRLARQRITYTSDRFPLNGQDLRTLTKVLSEQGVLEEEQGTMVVSVIDFGTAVARKVMTPRLSMICVDVSDPPRKALELIVAKAHSKLPLLEGDMDNVVGVIHERELLIAAYNGSIGSTSLRTLMRPVTFVPENKRLVELLRDMRSGNYTLAMVLDEYGGSAGLITLEDVLDEIVGEIRDEHDVVETDPIRMLSEGDAIVDAAVNIEKVNESLGTRLPDRDFETIGGYVLGRFGRVPQKGEELSENGTRLRIERMRNRRILSIRVMRTGYGNKHGG